MKTLIKIINNQNGHGPLSKKERIVIDTIVIATSLIWGLIYLIKKGVKKIKDRIKGKK